MLFKCGLSTSQLKVLDKKLLGSALIELLRSHRLGFHMLVLERHTVKALVELLEFGQEDGALLTRLSNEYTQFGNLTKNANIYVELTDQSYVRKTPKSIHFPITKISHTHVGNPTSLIVENIDNDGYVYDFVLHNMKSYLGIPQLNLELVHGGGEDIIKVFDKHLRNDKIVCCVIDSDKSYPTHEKCYKHTKLEKLYSNDHLAFVGSPPCREIENILPHSVIKLLQCVNCSNRNEVLHKIAEAELRLGYHPNQLFWLYFDIKKGLRFDDRQLSEETKKWLADRLSEAEIDENDFVITGFGERVISLFKDHNEAQAEFRKCVRTTPWLDVYQSFFSQLGWWFVSSRPLRT